MFFREDNWVNGVNSVWIPKVSLGEGLDPPIWIVRRCRAFLKPSKINQKNDIDFDRFLEPTKIQNRSKITQNSIQKSMLFSISFSDPFLIDFWRLFESKSDHFLNNFSETSIL